MSEFHDLAMAERPAPKTKRARPERAAQINVIAWLRLVFPGCVVAATVNEQGAASRDPMQRARFGMARRAAGVVSGFPDLTVAIQGGRTFFIEMKSEKGRLSEVQKDVHAKLHGLGHVVIVARDIDSAAAALRAEGLIR